MSVVFHAINGSGLGHLMRATAVIEALRRRRPALHIVLMTSAQSRAHLDEVASLGVPIVQVPPDEREPASALDRRLRTLPRVAHDALVAGAVSALSPRVVVFDTHAPVSVITAARTAGARIVLVLRPLREAALDAWLNSTAPALVDEVLVPCTASEFAAELGEPAVARLRSSVSTSFVGGIVRERPIDETSARAVAARADVKDDDFVIVFTSGGGGYDALQGRFVTRASALLANLTTQLARTSPRRVVGLSLRGPYADVAVSAPESAGAQLRVISDEPALATLLARADLVVGHAGNNTVEEVLRCGARAVLVPMARRAESQEARALRLHAVGRVGLVELDDDDDVWTSVALSQLQRPKPPREHRDGADVTADRIAVMVQEPRMRRLVLSLDDGDPDDVIRASVGAVVTLTASLGSSPSAIVALASAVAARRVRGARIDAVVGFVDRDVSVEERARALESARALGLPFVVDLTDADSPVVDVDRG
jgi:predicted glycosyltransferase